MELYVSISYSTNERVFIRSILDNLNMVKGVSGIIVSYGSQLYNGKQEDLQHIEELKKIYPNVFFCQYHVPRQVHNPYMYHNKSRITSVNMAFSLHNMKRTNSDGFWMLLLDADEIPDGAAFSEWFQDIANKDGVIYKLSNYWYFLDPRIIADVWEDSILLVHSSLLTPPALNHSKERDGIISIYQSEHNSNDKIYRNVLHRGFPMFHHYSWVRGSTDQLFQKISNWGHTQDKDWTALLNAALFKIKNNDIPNRDFVHNYPLHILPVSNHTDIPSIIKNNDSSSLS